MKIIITDIDTGEEEIVRVPAPRKQKDRYLTDETVRAQREFAMDAVILEGLKFMGIHAYIESPNSIQNTISPNFLIDDIMCYGGTISKGKREEIIDWLKTLTVERRLALLEKLQNPPPEH